MASTHTSTLSPIARLIDFKSTTLAESYGHFEHPRFALLIDDIFTADECKTLLAEAESHGKWEQALVNIGAGMQMLATGIRSSDRIMYTDTARAVWMHERVKPYLEEFGIDVLRSGSKTNSAIEASEWMRFHRIEGVKAWRATGLNEMLRFLRYQPGQYFKPHFDGTYCRPGDTERSFFTFHLYLGGTTKSGATRFLPTQYGAKEDDYIDVEAKMGRVLIFQHKGLLHEGQQLEDGEKFTMRTDIMYERVVDEQDKSQVDRRD